MCPPKSLLIACLMTAACVSSSTEAEPDIERGPIGKADVTDSCAPSDCGGPASDGNCYCDSECEQFGDCCANKDSVCDTLDTPDASLCGGDDNPLCPDGYECTLEGRIADVMSTLANGQFENLFQCEGLFICCDDQGNTDPSCAGTVRLTYDGPVDWDSWVDVRAETVRILQVAAFGGVLETVEPLSITVRNTSTLEMCNVEAVASDDDIGLLPDGILTQVTEEPSVLALQPLGIGLFEVELGTPFPLEFTSIEGSCPENIEDIISDYVRRSIWQALWRDRFPRTDLVACRLTQ